MPRLELTRSELENANVSSQWTSETGQTKFARMLIVPSESSITFFEEVVALLKAMREGRES